MSDRLSRWELSVCGIERKDGLDRLVYSKHLRCAALTSDLSENHLSR